jgi:hypothetical protein
MLYQMLFVGVLLFLVIILAIITTQWDPPAAKQCPMCDKRAIRESQSRCIRCLLGMISGYQCATCSVNFPLSRITLLTLLIALKVFLVICFAALFGITGGPLVAIFMMWILGLLTLARQRLKLHKTTCKECSI